MSANPLRDDRPAFQVPQKLKYSGVLPLAIPSTTRTREFQAISSEYAYNNNRVIRIHIAANDFLSGNESYLRFTVRNESVDAGGNATQVRIDHSAHSFFERVRIEGPDSTEIDRIDDYNVLAAMLGDFQHSPEWRTTQGNIMSGYSFERVADRIAGVNLFQDYDGYTAVLPANGTRTFTIPIISTFLSQSKMIPLKYMGKGLVLELTLAEPSYCLVSSTTAQGTVAAAQDDVLNYRVSNVAYMGRLLSFNQMFEQAFEQVMSQGDNQGNPIIQFHSPTWRGHQHTLAGATDSNIPIAERASSVKSIFAVFRDQLTGAIANDSSVSKVGGRAKAGVRDYQFRIGSVLYPPNRVTVDETGAEAYTELKKAFGSLHSVDDMGAVRVDHYNAERSQVARVALPLNAINILASAELIAALPGALGAGAGETANLVANLAIPAGIPAYTGKFALGIDMESFPHEKYQSGLDTTQHSMNIELLVGRVAAAVGPPAVEGGIPNTRCDVYTLIDQVVTLTPTGDLMVSR